MGLQVCSLSLHNFRNFTEKSIEFCDATTILAGKNASGKTNTLEALQLLTSGRSFKHASAEQLIKDGEEQSRLTAVLRGDGREIDVSCSLEEGKKHFKKNGKKTNSNGLTGLLPSVLFTPDDLSIVKRSASYRRDEIDAFARQINTNYRKFLSTYTRTVEQRNKLLKEPDVAFELIEAWNESLATGAATLLLARRKLFERLSEKISLAYERIAGDEQLTCEYVSSIGNFSPNDDREELKERVLSKLYELQGEELARRQTLVGPHRDDINFCLNKKNTRDYASQGQQRSVAIAIKLAEVELCKEILGDTPLLLLDDVMSELDESRRAALAEFSLQGVQTVITTTNLGYFSKESLSQAKVVSYE